MNRKFSALHAAWLSKTVRGGVLAVTLVFVGVASSAQSADGSAEKLRSSLGSLSNTLGQLGDPGQAQDDLGKLAEALPLTGANPLESIDWDQLIEKALDRGTTDALASVDGYVAELSGPVDVGGGLTVDVVAAATGTGNQRDITIGLTIDPTTSFKEIPLTLPTDAVDINGGVVRVGVDLDASLKLRFDSNPLISDPKLALILTEEPSISLAFALSTPTPASLEANLGFTKVDVELDVVAAELGFTLALESPHAAGTPAEGTITMYDWETTSLEDLVTVGKTGALDAALSLDSDLIPASPDVEVSVKDNDLSDGFQPKFSEDITSLVATPGEASLLALLNSIPDLKLPDFTNLSPSQVLTGLGQLAGALESLSAQADLPLPFMQGGVGRSLELTQQLVSALSQQTVVCGRQNTQPPSGSVVGLGVGDKVYCSATTTDAVDAGSVTWTAALGTVGTNGSGATADGTVAAVPSKNVEITVTTAGVPPVVTAGYENVDGITKGASQPVPTAQDLIQQLIDVAGFQGGVGNSALTYDEATNALLFKLVRTIPLGVEKEAGVDFADKLKSGTGLFGLSSNGSASIKVKASDVRLELTFGVLIGDQSDIPEADPAVDADSASTFLDRFFVQPGAGGTILTVGDIDVTAALTLEGRIGFVEVSATGVSGATSLTITKPVPANPLLSLGLEPQAGFTAGGAAVTDAIQTSNLLNDLADQLAAPLLNLEASGGLVVTASVGGTTLGTGTVTFEWGPVTTVADLTDASKLSVVANSSFEEGLQKFDEISNDPMALLNVILDAFDQLAASSEESDLLDAELPLVGSSPRDVLTQFQKIRQAVTELRGAPSATLVCRNTTADSAGRTAATAIVGDTVACRAETSLPAETAQWSVTGGTAGANAAAAATVGPPPVSGNGTEFAFTVGATGMAAPGNTTGYRVTLAWTDQDGPHNASLPSLGAPPTLQALNAAIVQKLGLTPGSLVLALEDVDVPGGGAELVKSLRLKLDFGVCTTGNAACTPASVVQPKSEVPLNVDLGNLGEGGGPSYGLTTEGTVAIEYDASAVLDLGIPLSTSPVPFVFGGTGAQASIKADATGVGLMANIGPIGVKLGTLAGAGKEGIVKLAGGVSVTSGAGPNAPLSFADFATGIAVSLNSASPALSCGSVDYDGAGGADPQAIEGQVCARLGLTAVIGADVPLDDIGFSWAGFAAPGTVQVFVDPDLLQKLKDSVLSIDFLLRALPPLLEELEAGLRSGGAGATKIPVIGSSLDAGADVVGKLNAGFITPVATTLSAAVGPYSTAGELEDKIQLFLFNQLGSATQGATGAKLGLLLENDGAPGVTQEDVTMTLTCGGIECTPATDIVTIPSPLEDIRLDFSIGQGLAAAASPVAAGPCVVQATCASPAALPFDVGLDGLPLRIAGALEGDVSWKVRLDFGLSRDKGPYLGVNHENAGVKQNDVQIGAAITLGDKADVCATDDTPYRESVPEAQGAFSDTRCLLGTLGFLTVNVRDAAAEADRTGVFLTAGLHLTGAGAGPNGVLGLNDIIGGKLGVDFQAGVQAKVDIMFRAGITDLAGDSIGFPAVLGTFSLGWDYSVGTGAPADSNAPTILFDDVYLDGGAFLSKYLKPVADQVKNVTSPLKPVLDTLSTPIPVVSDLAALVGQPPVTLISLAETASGNDLSLVKSAVAFLQFVNNFPPGESLLIPLKTGGSTPAPGAGGSFTVPFAAAKTPQTPSSAGSLVSSPDAGTNIGAALGGGAGDSTATGDGRYQTFGVPGLDVPLLREPAKVFSVLMGQDVTLIEYEFGGLSATAGFSYSFGPFMVGPVPVVISIGGSVQIDGHFAIGYDTSGLRAVFGGAGPEAVLNGLYLKDFDNTGADVAEIKLTGTVYAGAAVSISIVSAGIEAGLRLTVGLDLDDRPNNDGKLNFDEIVNRIANPICLFTVEGSLDAFLKAFVEFDFFVASVRFEFTIVEIRLLDFSAGCAPPTPVPATPDGGTLKLNIGDRANVRALNVAELNEKVVVRPLEGAPGFSVEIFGAYEEYRGNFTVVTGDGKAGKDEVLLASGSKTSGTAGSKTCTATDPCELVWPSGTRAEISGGEDNDKITTATGNDTVNAGGGNDKIATGPGNDTVNGGGGNDTIDGGVGTDTLYGGSGALYSEVGDGSDTIQGGPGEDTIYGGTGPDLLSGGPGVKPGTAGAPADSVDLKDTIYGGSGPDSLVGHEGDDDLYGDELLALDCAAAGLGPQDGDANNDDRIEGGPGNDDIAAGSGNDLVKGHEGNDVLCGNGGNDTIDGDEPTGTGDDIVRGGPGQDVLNGNAGNDVVDGGTGNDNALGGAGHDAVLGGTGRDRVDGSDGDDLVVGEDGTLAAGVPGNLGGQSALVNKAKVSGIDDATNAAETPLDCVSPYDQSNSTSGNSDCVSGGAGNDAAYGGGGRDTVLGDDGADWLDGGSGGDVLRGGLLDDIAYGRTGDDMVFGDSGNDDLFGNEDKDTMYGGTGSDDVEGNGDADTVYGDGDVDRLIGGSSGAPYEQADGADEIRGGAADDVIVGDNATIAADGTTAMATSATVAGTFGNDKIYGEAGADQVYGQQGGDTIEGGADADYVVGDLGAITTPAVVPATWPGGAPKRTVVLQAQAVGGVDTISGGPADDRAYGGADDDVMNGDGGDDYLEGNGGRDTMKGGTEQDDLIGGSSTVTVPENPRLDVGELTMEGGPGVDVLAGDNADITRTPATATTWAQDPITGGAARTVALIYSNIAVCAGFCGGDLMKGDDANDRLYGEGGDDTILGGAGDDYAEGNQNSDTINGNTGEDDILGGSSEVASGTGHGRTGRPDQGDFLYGDEDADVIAGDNGVITRAAADGFAALTDRPGMLQRRAIELLDRIVSAPNTFGNDQVFGNDGVDVLFGQSGADVLKGNNGDDFAEGGQDTDLVEGNAGQDDLVGGSTVAISGSGEDATGQPDGNDALYGGADADLVVGDNAQILRVGTTGYPFSPLTDRLAMTRRTLRLLDLGKSGSVYPTDASAATPTRAGRDTLSGGSGVDVLLGQDAGDWISGGPGDDYAEGNGGADELGGDRLLSALGTAPAAPTGVSVPPELDGPAGSDGQDDLIGGSSNLFATSTGVLGRNGFRDGNDRLWGDGAADFELGDNGTLVREESSGGGSYKRYRERYPTAMVDADDPAVAFVRHAVRVDVLSSQPGTGNVFGNDTIEGNDGDDFVWGQSGNDTIRGGNGDDDLIGELGEDEIFGEAGQDAVIGDRGGIISRFIDGSAGDPTQKSVTLNAPPKETLTYFRNGTLDRRVDLKRDVQAHTGATGSVDTWSTAALPLDGETTGSADRIRGGLDRDSLHGAAGNDLVNGDSGGDVVFGGNGSDVMWGGRGCDPLADAATPDCLVGGLFAPASRGTNDRFVDHVFGGYGGLDAAGRGTPELLDFRPRGSTTKPGLSTDPTATCTTDGKSSAGSNTTGAVDPCSWFAMTDIGPGLLAQHYQGTDWLYGGYDRDVLEGDVTGNGPNPGDRLMDWFGVFNLFNHCNSAYGGFNDVRLLAPQLIEFTREWAFAMGAGETLARVGQSGTSGFGELGLVTTSDQKGNTGKAYPTTPGHFELFSCAAD